MWGSLCPPRILTGQVILPSISFPDDEDDEDDDDDDVDQDSDYEEETNKCSVEILQ